MLNRSASLAMSTCVLKALPGKLDIKRHSPSILYNLIWCTVSRLMDEAIPLDHHRRLVWPQPLNVIQYARSNYCYNNVYVSSAGS